MNCRPFLISGDFGISSKLDYSKIPGVRHCQLFHGNGTQQATADIASPLKNSIFFHLSIFHMHITTMESITVKFDH